MRGGGEAAPPPVPLPEDVSERIGSRDGSGKRFAIAASRFHPGVTSRLVEGAVRALLRNRVAPGDIEVIYVPGAFELPAACRKLVDGGNLHGVIALGCVIQGETPHFEYVAGATAHGLGALAASASIPLVFGVLTTENLQQALDRAGRGEDNKGFESALSVLEMANLFGDLDLR